MGSIRKGFPGGVSGKVGPVVGESWQNVDYMRSMPKISKTKNPKIVIQNAKFSLASKFLRTISGLLEGSFPEQSSAMTSRNTALVHLLKKAIIGEYPDFAFKYRNVIIARAGLLKR